jgi:hypothetical protein
MFIAYYSDFTYMMLRSIPAKGWAYVPQINAKCYEGKDENSQNYLIHVMDAKTKLPKALQKIKRADTTTQVVFGMGSHKHIKDGALFAFVSQKHIRVTIQFFACHHGL